jgi:1,4-dihydroxy-2-naphthoate octaprenyltransferase
VQTLAWSPAALWGGVAAGCFSVAILSVNNFRDWAEDRRSGKRTLAVRFGPALVRAEYRLALLGAALVPLWMIHRLDQPGALMATTLLCLAMLPLLWRAMAGEPGEDEAFGGTMNRLLGLTGRLELLYAVLFAAAYLL